MDRIWHQKCVYIGSGSPKEETKSWKDVYIISHQKLNALEKNNAFKSDTCIPGAMSRSAIRGFVYIQNYILIGNHNMIYLIRLSNQEIIGKFQVPYKLSFLAASDDGSTIGIGQHNGIVTSWKLEFKKDVNFQKIWESEGHSSQVTCLCVKPESEIVCSGSNDRLVTVIMVVH